MSELEAPWDCRVHQRAPRDIPADVLAALSRQDAVEAATDALIALGLRSHVAFPPGTLATPDFGVQVGAVLTLRYVPKKVASQDNRLGHDLIAKTVRSGDVLIGDQHGCNGGVAGGNAVGKLQRAGARAIVIDGSARDFDDPPAGGLPSIATSWGIASGRTSVELVAIGEPINFCGVAVHPGDVAIVNRFGMALVPETLPWAELLTAAKLA